MMLDKLELVVAMQAYHSGQMDKQGCPYWIHPYRVALEAKKKALTFDFGVDPMRVFATGLFHDVFEDTNASVESVASHFHNDPHILFDLIMLTDPKEVQKKRLLDTDLLSREQKHLIEKSWAANQFGTYEGWVEAIIDFASPAASLVKYEDNTDNSLPWRSKRLLGVNRKYDTTRKFLREHLLSLIEEDGEDLFAEAA